VLAKSDTIWYFPRDKVHHNLLWKEWKNLEDRMEEFGRLSKGSCYM